jgi:hypothetical protein
MTMTTETTANPKTRITVHHVLTNQMLFSIVWDRLEDEDEVATTPDLLRLIGDRLKARLDAAAAYAKTLEADGWRVAIHQQDMQCRHPRVRTIEQAIRRLAKLGLACDPYDADRLAQIEAERSPFYARQHLADVKGYTGGDWDAMTLKEIHGYITPLLADESMAAQEATLVIHTSDGDIVPHLAR